MPHHLTNPLHYGGECRIELHHPPNCELPMIMGPDGRNTHPRKIDDAVMDSHEENLNWGAYYSPEAAQVKPQVEPKPVKLVKQHHPTEPDPWMVELLLGDPRRCMSLRSLMDPPVSGVCWNAAAHHGPCHMLGHRPLGMHRRVQICMNHPTCICWIGNACTTVASPP